MRRVALVLAAVLFSAVGAKADVANTWREAVVVLPASATASGEYQRLTGIGLSTAEWARETAGLLKPGTKLPAVIYLHGCSGFGVMDAWALILQGLGITVFAPDSFARPGRRVLCGTGDMQPRMRQRLEEAAYARAQLRSIDWVDDSRVILMGFSEGGSSTADYGDDEYIARIPIGTDCRNQGGSPNRGPDSPVLNIVGSRDHYGYGDGCSIWESEDGSRALVIDGAGHDVSSEPEAIAALMQFLDKCCGIKAPDVAFDVPAAAKKLVAEYGDLATVFAFQNSEDALNAGDAKGHENWLAVKDYIDAGKAQ